MLGGILTFRENLEIQYGGCYIPLTFLRHCLNILYVTEEGIRYSLPPPPSEMIKKTGLNRVNGYCCSLSYAGARRRDILDNQRELRLQGKQCLLS